MKWDQGRSVIDRMLADGELQRVPASREQADRLIDQPRAHLSSAAEICTKTLPADMPCSTTRLARPLPRFWRTRDYVRPLAPAT